MLKPRFPVLATARVYWEKSGKDFVDAATRLDGTCDGQVVVRLEQQCAAVWQKSAGQAGHFQKA